MNRHHHRITHAIVVSAALSLGATSPASADQQFSQARALGITSLSRLVNLEPSRPRTPASTSLCSEVCSAGGYSSANSTTADANYAGPRSEVVSGGGYGSASVPATVVRVVAPDGSFNWGDAGIGAGAALVLIGIGLASTRAATTSRSRHTRQEGATVSS